MDGETISNNSNLQKVKETNTIYIKEYQEHKTNYLLYILIGIGTLFVLGLIIFLLVFIGSKEISERDLSLGTIVTLKENEEVEFSIDEEKHKIIVESINPNSVDIVIQSEPINLNKLNLKVGEENKFDLDGDGTYDLKVILNKIEDGKADIYILKISEVICEENWVCDQWSKCVGGQQNKICVDTNSCGTEENKPSPEVRACQIDQCATNTDCNDNNSSTEDICSGALKLCSNILITSCKNNDNYCPPGCTNNNDSDCEAIIELIDCGTSVDTSTLQEITVEEQLEGGGTLTTTTRDYDSDEALVCMGNNLLDCIEGKVIINQEEGLINLEIKEKIGSSCEIRIEYGQMAGDFSSLSNQYIECPISINDISSLPCFSGPVGCTFEGSPGHITTGLVGKMSFLRILGGLDSGCKTGNL